LKNIKFHENLPVRAELFSVDGQIRPTNITKLIVTYCSFVNAPKKVAIWYCWKYCVVCAIVNTLPVNMQKVPTS
jgi:hypothetical protein